MYEMQGGSVNIIVCDDGLQLLPLNERNVRLEYYHVNHMGVSARPPEGTDGFIRRGRFKKAGNLNYCYQFSQRIEEAFKSLLAARANDRPVQDHEENVLYHRAMDESVSLEGGWFSGNLRMSVSCIFSLDELTLTAARSSFSLTRIPEFPEIASWKPPSKWLAVPTWRFCECS